MNRRIPIFRLGFVAAGMGLLVFAAFAFRDYRRLRRELGEAEAARLGEIAVDLSRPGRFAVNVARTYRRAHGVNLMLQLIPPTGHSADPQPLTGLKATVRLVYPDGTESEKDVIDLQRVPSDGDEIHLYGIGGGPDNFAFVLDVDEGASHLTGYSQRLSARYGLCGLESLSGTICGIVSLGSALLAVIAAGWDSTQFDAGG